MNTLTGEGLAEVLVGADVVVDVSNSPSFADDDVLDFFSRSTSNLLAAEKVAGVGHHVALSIVGTDRLPASGYLRAKVAQEKLIRDGGVPFSIVHATQFYEFTDAIAQAATVGDEVHLSTGYFQPMAADDVVAALGPIVVGAPIDGIQEIGGPVKARMSDFVAAALAAQGDPRTVVADAQATYFGAVLDRRRARPRPGRTPQRSRRTTSGRPRRPPRRAEPVLSDQHPPPRPSAELTADAAEHRRQPASRARRLRPTIRPDPRSATTRRSCAAFGTPCCHGSGRAREDRVIGATGLVGSQLVAQARQQGHEIVGVCPEPGTRPSPSREPDGGRTA